MGKIQDALSRLQAAQARPEQPAAVVGVGRPARSPGAARSEFKSEAEPHQYKGSPLVIDYAALRSAGMLPPAEQARLFENEFKAIKRPLLKNIVSADPPIRRSNLWLTTSALASEGKSFTSLNLAMSLAREKERHVVLVDADCGKARLTNVFRAEGEKGLLDVLRDPAISFDSVVRPTSIDGLNFLPLGRIDEHVTELLSSSRFGALCEFLATSDPSAIILFDSSPILLTAEASILAAQAGQVILVVRALATARHAVLEAYNRLDPDMPINLVLTHAGGADSINAFGNYYAYDPNE